MSGLLIETVGELPEAPKDVPVIYDPRSILSMPTTDLTFDSFIRPAVISTLRGCSLNLAGALAFGNRHLQLIAELTGVTLLPHEYVQPPEELTKQIPHYLSDSQYYAIVGAVVPLVQPVRSNAESSLPDFNIPREQIKEVRDGLQAYYDHCDRNEKYGIADSFSHQIMYGKLASEDPKEFRAGLYYVDVNIILELSADVGN